MFILYYNECLYCIYNEYLYYNECLFGVTAGSMNTSYGYGTICIPTSTHSGTISPSLTPDPTSHTGSLSSTS